MPQWPKAQVGFATLVLWLGLAGTTHANEPLVWAGCDITRNAFMAELAKAYAQRSGTRILLEGGGASQGIHRVGDHSAHIGGACRARLGGHPDELAAKLNPVAWDALVVIVNQSNPVNDIDIDQLRQIYEGKITSWQPINGQDKPIRLMTRRGLYSGVGRTLRELVWGDPEQLFTRGPTFATSGELEQAVVGDPYAIGITGIGNARLRPVKIVKLNGWTPDYANIRSGNYPLYRPIYIAYNPTGPRAAEVRRFIDFAHTSEARKLIRSRGVVPYLDAIHLTRRTRDLPLPQAELAEAQD